jgi:hypothetical protein
MATTYFAYGTNMSRAQMAYRCPGAAVVCGAVLRHHRFHINRQGVATVAPDPAAEVHGVLWMITDEDERALDRYEGVADGLYGKERQRVHLLVGSTPEVMEAVEALIYVARDPARGVPKTGYLEQVIAGAESHGLPPEYVAEIRAWGP